MKSYLISTITDFIDAPIALVYSIVTDNSNFQWREEVKNIELLEDSFIEYYKAGGHTLFSNIQKIENEYSSSFLEIETYTTELHYCTKTGSICKQISIYHYGSR